MLEAKHELCPSLTDVVWTHDVLSSYRYRLDVRCQDFLNRYLGHSLISPDNPLMVQVNRSLLSMTFNVSSAVSYILGGPNGNLNSPTPA